MTDSTELTVIEAQPLAPRTPADTMAQAGEIASVVADVVQQQGLYTKIGNKKYTHVEGWTTMLGMMNVVPREVGVLEHNDGEWYEATVELFNTTTGQVVGRASAECGRGEADWAKRAAFQRRSMAVTRATGKAARLAFSWIMVLAGYAACPAEEIIEEKEEQRASRPQASAPKAARNPSDVPCIPGGNEKGMPITEASEESLLYWLQRMRNEHPVADPRACSCAGSTNKRFHERNRKEIQQYEAELDLRKG